MAAKEGIRMKFLPLTTAVATCIALVACREPNAPEPAPASVAAEPAQPQQMTTPNASTAQLDAQQPVAASICNVESINNGLFSGDVAAVRTGDMLRGWLGHDNPATLTQPRVLFRDSVGAAAAAADIALTIQRDDVVDSNSGREDLRKSGFEVLIPPLGPGTYALVLRYAVNGQAFVCDNGRRIRID